MKYNHKKIEAKWQKFWEQKKLHAAKDFSQKPKYYALFEFPYPSGDGLHVGHIRPYVGMDIISRKRRMEGYNVLFPVGWDAFGLPTENYAIKTGISPEIATKKNSDNFRRQMRLLGLSLDWNREINTTDPNYYKWTQWMFLQFFKHGLAYKASVPINWCPKDKIGLANEEVIGGKCERCGTEVEQRQKEQWMLKITAYADKLLEGLKDLDFLPEIKRQQENWIGKSEGALIKFALQGVTGQPNSKHFVEVFTTRPDTIFGATFIAIAPEVAQKWIAVGWQISTEVKNYIAKTLKEKSEAGNEGVKEKTGINIGIRAINPANQEEIPVWIVNYVLGDVGTGAIMAVPAHDDRDLAFAKAYNLDVKPVVARVGSFEEIKDPISLAAVMKKSCLGSGFAILGEGFLINSGQFSGMPSEKAKWEITKAVGGKREIKYKLRDWVFSRQRYWGEPIPLIHCEKCGYVPVPEKNLPVKLPKVKDYQPRDDGQSPLASVEKWVKVKCPQCKGIAKRETDVMPNWAGSSWYFLRYTDPKNKKNFSDIKKLKYWMPVDWYNGGMEHVTLHLLYSRFWNQFLYDIGVVPVKEPYKKRTAHGLILAEGGMKMSKSKGNVINPDSLIKEFGADALRLYEMFIGPFNQAVAWDQRGIMGTSRFLERVWNLGSKSENGKIKGWNSLERLINKTIKKVTEDIESMSFNTAVSAMMIFVNECQSFEKIPAEIWEKFLLLLAPFAPHIAEELWMKAGGKKSLSQENWPEYDKKLIDDATIELLIQVNGKVRDKISVSKSTTQAEAEKLAFQSAKAQPFIGSQKPKKIIFVPGKLINFVV